MNAEFVAVGLGIVATVGQVMNYLLHLKLKAAILESEQKTLEKVEERYVRKDTFRATMERFEEH